MRLNNLSEFTQSEHARARCCGPGDSTLDHCVLLSLTSRGLGYSSDEKLPGSFKKGETWLRTLTSM